VRLSPTGQVILFHGRFKPWRDWFALKTVAIIDETKTWCSVEASRNDVFRIAKKV
jgi:hypothetical protein